MSTKIAKKKSSAGSSVASKDSLRSVGRRKTAAARVRLTPGTGNITINGIDYKEYLPYFEWQNIVMAPLTAVAKDKTFDISVKIVGGGKKGQAVSIQLGIARALVIWNDELKKTLKTQGYLTRDARVKERKKPGLKRARRAPQWSKR